MHIFNQHFAQTEACMFLLGHSAGMTRTLDARIESDTKIPDSPSWSSDAGIANWRPACFTDLSLVVAGSCYLSCAPFPYTSFVIVVTCRMYEQNGNFSTDDFISFIECYTLQVISLLSSVAMLAFCTRPLV